MKCDFGWADLGMWHSIYESQAKGPGDNVVIDSKVLLDDSHGNIIKLPSDHVGIINGLENYIVAEKDNVLLICHKEDSSALVRKYINEFRFGQLQLLAAEVSIALGLHGNQMDVGVGHFQSQNHLCNLAAGECLLDGNGHPLGELLVVGKFFVVHVEEIVHLTARNHECMTFHQRVNVEERIKLLVFSTFIAGNLTGSNLCKNIHDFSD